MTSIFNNGNDSFCNRFYTWDTVLSSYADDADRYVREAEYYLKKVDGYRREAAYYLKKAEQFDRDAAYYTKRGKTDTAKSYQSRAKRAIDSYKTQLRYASSSDEKAANYLKRASNALER